MEKPFGTDLASAQALNARGHEVFGEQQVFRIDHFLDNEQAQNILAFRFGNGLLEPVWNREHIDHVQIDVPEMLSIEGRAGSTNPPGPSATRSFSGAELRDAPWALGAAWVTGVTDVCLLASSCRFGGRTRAPRGKQARAQRRRRQPRVVD